MAWGPVFVALILFSGYESLHVGWQEFLYVDDYKSIPDRLHLAKDSYHFGLGLGALGLAFITVRYIIVRALK